MTTAGAVLAARRPINSCRWVKPTKWPSTTWRILQITTDNETTDYAVEQISVPRSSSDFVVRAYSLTKLGLRSSGDRYIVHEHPRFGWDCDCASQTMSPQADGCKHIRALRAALKSVEG